MPSPAVAAAGGCDPNDTSLFGALCRDIAAHVDYVGPIVQHLIPAVLVFAVVLVGGGLLRRFAGGMVTRGGGDRQVRTLIHNVLTVATFVFAVLGGLTAAGLNLGVLLTFGGLATVAVGLAFQDILRNLFAGIVLLVERPFRLGDMVSVSGQVGVVETINLRTTALRTADGQLAILPNLTAFTSTLVNASAYDLRRYSIAVRVEAGVDLEPVLRRVRHEVEDTKELAPRPEPTVVPRLDLDGWVELTCNYWLPWREHSPDAVTADLARRLYDATGRMGLAEAT